MKRFKIILLCLIGVVSSCTKVEIVPTPQPEVKKVFDVTESTVVDKQDLIFDLPSTGMFILTIRDKNTNQVISRERFNGKIGENIKKIYTNSLPKGYLYLVLEDVDKNQLKKTTIIIN
jgi:hypothetical protein